jgi:hypothetical protein
VSMATLIQSSVRRTGVRFREEARTDVDGQHQPVAIRQLEYDCSPLMRL